jgi:hypothetical protein
LSLVTLTSVIVSGARPASGALGGSLPQLGGGDNMTVGGAHEPDRYRRFAVAFNPGDTIEQDDGLRDDAFGRLGVNPCPCFNRRPQGVTPAHLQQTGEP